MPEKTKQKNDSQKPVETTPAEPFEKKEECDPGAWGRDQFEKSYYYDDAHGYELYKPEEEDDEEDV